jgi:hypothetical protein
MRSRILPLAALAVCLMFLEARAQVVQTSEVTVEFIGLEKWTPKMIQEKLGYDSPDQLQFCALVLKEQLKFPDVYVFRFSGEGNYTVIRVIIYLTDL